MFNSTTSEITNLIRSVPLAMEENGKIISTCDIDNSLALQIWTKGRMPRLSILNKSKNSRKLIQMSWIEKRDRTLSIQGRRRGESSTYTVSDFEPAVQKILNEYTARTNFKVKFLKLVLDLERALGHPEIISRESDFALMTEEKRSALWIAECTGDDKGIGIFLPFFPMNDAETEAAPDNKLEFNDIKMRTTDGLIKTGVPAALKKVNPERWHNPVRVTAAAMLLGFSYCGVDGTKTAEAIWSEGEKIQPTQPGQMVTMKTPVKRLSIHDASLGRLGHKMTAYMRHYYYADKVNVEYMYDSDKALQDSGFTKSRRVDFGQGALGDVPYRVTFYVNEAEGTTSFGCNPKMQTSRHIGDMVITIPTDIYNQALENDTMGNKDDFFTLTRLLWARQYHRWYNNVRPYVSGFAGLVNS